MRQEFEQIVSARQHWKARDACVILIPWKTNKAAAPIRDRFGSSGLPAKFVSLSLIMVSRSSGLEPCFLSARSSFSLFSPQRVSVAHMAFCRPSPPIVFSSLLLLRPILGVSSFQTKRLEVCSRQHFHSAKHARTQLNIHVPMI